MPVNIIRDPQLMPIDPLRDRTIAVLGYGNQGHAHALNLRDSGLSVVVGQRKSSPRYARALADGFETSSLAEATARADLVIIALPDEMQSHVVAKEVLPALKADATLGFIHGFAIHFQLIAVPADACVIMVAPKGPGTLLRQRYVDGSGLPCLVAVHQDATLGDGRSIALAWAAGIGAARTACIETTFAHETETDLFGEQVVLCGGLCELITAAFDELVRAGYPSELAYLECCHEVKQIADLVYQTGLAAMQEKVSNTAEFGGYVAGPKIIDAHVRERMREQLRAIQSGSFATQFMADIEAGGQRFHEERVQRQEHPIEAAGRIVRSLMSPPQAPQDREG